MKKLKFKDKQSDFNTLKENIESIVLKNEDDDREILLDFIERSLKLNGGSKTKRRKTIKL